MEGSCPFRVTLRQFIVTIHVGQAHDAAVTKLSWAHPEFGSVLASSSFDRTVKIWEEIASDNHMRVYECLEAPALSNWTLVEETDVLVLPSTLTSRPHTYAAPTPTQI